MSLLSFSNHTHSHTISVPNPMRTDTILETDFGLGKRDCFLNDHYRDVEYHIQSTLGCKVVSTSRAHMKPKRGFIEKSKGLVLLAKNCLAVAEFIGLKENMIT